MGQRCAGDQYRPVYGKIYEQTSERKKFNNNKETKAQYLAQENFCLKITGNLHQQLQSIFLFSVHNIKSQNVFYQQLKTWG